MRVSCADNEDAKTCSYTQVEVVTTATPATTAVTTTTAAKDKAEEKTDEEYIRLRRKLVATINSHVIEEALVFAPIQESITFP
jgi:hypothetical protein